MPQGAEIDGGHHHSHPQRPRHPQRGVQAVFVEAVEPVRAAVVVRSRPLISAQRACARTAAR